MYVVKTIKRHLGWCPNVPALRTASMVLSTPPVTVHPLEPDGGAGDSGRIGRGITLATGSIKTLIRNNQLLWFSLLTGLVMAFIFIARYGLHLLGTYPYNSIDFPRWVVLTFAVELFTVFCLIVLLAGLVLSLLPEETGRPVSFRDRLSRVKGYLRPLADWAVTLALCGTALFVPFHYYGNMQFILYTVLDLFPFNFLLLPEVYSTGPIGGTYAMLSAVTSAIVISGINGLLFVLTLFVVPLVVLENKRLPEAVTGSVTLMKNVWCEVISCFLIFCIVLFAVSLTALLFRIVYEIISPDMLLFWYLGAAWIAAAVLFMLALCGLAFIISTVAGIATVNLYTYGKTGRMPGMPKGEQETKCV
ncbi:MAG: DUF6159 family protein [Methanoregula sp.]|nr:MAG: DUF6159 family protein [Methanoregula sp.]